VFDEIALFVFEHQPFCHCLECLGVDYRQRVAGDAHCGVESRELEVEARGQVDCGGDVGVDDAGDVFEQGYDRINGRYQALEALYVEFLDCQAETEFDIVG